jgi:CubicO group peptidase (beta-lactamase class C family)
MEENVMKFTDAMNKHVSRRGFLKSLTAGALAYHWVFQSQPMLAGDTLEGLLEPIRRQYSLPALAGMFGQGDNVVALGAVGRRQALSTIPVQPDDLFHIGSNTKSMTATLIAMLVEAGYLSWQTTIADVFSDLTIQPDYNEVTVLQLLSHRSGITDLDSFHQRAWTLTGPLPDQRYTMAGMVLGQRPQIPPGSQYRYSNWGYIMAGTIAEQVTGEAWEDLITEWLFAPLGMDRAGFGAPGTPGMVDQPWGHSGTNCQPVSPGRFADNPPVYGPAGTVHCSLSDYFLYGQLHVSGGRGQTGLLLTPESFQTLHRDWYNQGYALGWGLADRTWAGGRALSHAGSNTYWYHLVWLAPARDAVLVAATNCSANAFQACDSVIAGMINRYLS